jgi:hypothetical protein
MRRALLALAVLLTASASPALAGYIILRVLLEGGAGPADGSSSPGGEGPMPGLPGGSGFLRPGGVGRQPTPKMAGGPMMPMPGAPGSAGPMAAAPAEEDPTRSVIVVVPLEGDFLKKHLDSSGKSYFNPMDNPSYRQVNVPFYGKNLHASLFIDSSTIQLYEQAIGKPAPRRTVATEVFNKHEQWRRDKKDPQVLYDAMMMALHAGIVRDPVPVLVVKQAPSATSMAQELLDVAAEKKLTLPADAARFVAAWGKVGKALKQPAAQSDDVETWKVRLDANASRVDGRYALVYWDRETTADEVTRRGKQLNDNLTAFYLWHAARGVELPLPEKPLLVVLAKAGQSMRPLQHALDGLPAQTDAFFAPEHNVLVLSPEPLDDVAQTFLRQNQQLFNKGYSRTALLNRQIPKLDSTGEKGSPPEEVARANTLALIEKLMLNDSEVAAISHEGTRQLMFATGVLPRHVTLPNWLSIGAANAFTRPRGPAFITQGEDDKPYMTVALANGFGTPNYVLHRYFIEMGDRYHKELNPDPVKMLEYVLTDAYFGGIKNGDDPDPAPPKKPKKPAPAANATTGGPGASSPYTGGPKMPGPGGRPGMGGALRPGAGIGITLPFSGPSGGYPAATITTDEEDPAVTLRKKRARLSIKANATAWALYYYLANARPDELKIYLAELNKLPRDLPIDGRTSREAFVRAFGLSAAKGGAADPARMKQFANDWLGYIATVPPAGFDVALEVPEPPKTNTPGGSAPYPKGPGGPFQPGGPAGP